MSSPAVAASLSFVLPGLGQLSLGAVRRGLVAIVPAAVVFAAVVGLALAGPRAVIDAILRPEILVALLILNAILAVYHVAAIVDAYRLARLQAGRRVAGRAGPLILALVLTATVGLHGTLEVVGYQSLETMQAVFVPGGPDGGWVIPKPSFSPSPSPTSSPTPSPVAPSPAATASPTPIPTPTPSPPPPWAADGRLDVLLVGSDAGPDRWSLRTDTMIVLSIDVETGRTALFGIPRNLVGVPLPPESQDAFPDGRFPGLLNALYVYAMGHQAAFPGGEARGFRAVSGAVQELVGVALDGVVVVDLRGFVRLVDAIGGLWIDVPDRLVDRAYPLEDGSGYIRLDIRSGCQQLDGRMALAYARSRRQDSDYGRMRRQQQVLVALAHQVDPLALVPKVPDLLAIARDHLWTTIDRAEVGGLAELAARVDPGSVKTVRFVPPRYPSHLTTSEIAKIQKVVRTVFDGSPARPSPSPSATPSSCP